MENLEALLTDLENTTEVLKRANLPKAQHVEEMSMVRAQHAVPATQNLHDLDQMLDDFSTQRKGGGKGGRPTVESLLDELDSAVPNGDVYRSERHGDVQKASRDLDNVMDSLNRFKMQSNSVDPSYAQPQKSPRSGNQNQLDSMLGQLDTDMNKHGINTVPKGDCAACDRAIVGQVVIALGKMWHPEHFCCAHCGETLGHKNFFERTGQAYCEQDYHNLFSPRCAYCNGPIKDKCITALDKTWHPDHFFCAHCGKDFGDEGFHERDGKAYCRQDYFTNFAPKCRGCDRPIMQSFITALGTQWHPECFVCQDCHRPFSGGSFFDHLGAPYCETHYHEKRGSLCAQCLKPISGRCVTAMGKKFHPEHFVCSFCLRQLNKGTFKEHETKPYCHECFNKLLS